VTAPAYRWVACGRDTSWAASTQRHLIIPGHITTVCGHTASVPDVWRGNSTKPPCPTCERVAEGREVPVPPAPGISPEDVARIRKEYRRYAFNKLKVTRDAMAQDVARDAATGQLEGLHLVRAEARLASYNDLISVLDNLKGLL
jgi:hypothetical protein